MLATKDVIIIADKSRADYFRERRKGKKQFNVLLDEELVLGLEEKLKEENKTRKEWLEEKIRTELKK